MNALATSTVLNTLGLQKDHITQEDIIASYCLASTLNFTRHFFKVLNGKKFSVGEHHKLICQKLDEVIQGKCNRLIINIAPRYGKTELAVKSFIAYGLALNPKSSFLHLSYSSTLAMDNSLAIRRFIENEEYQKIFPRTYFGNKNTQTYWNTSEGGGVYATSTLGQVTGFGAGATNYEGEEKGFSGAIIIDDPVKPEDAFSDIEREKINRRFETTIRSRVNSRDTPIIIIMQRLHLHDLCGYLLQTEPESWEVLSLPCVKKDGSVLWPERQTIEELEAVRMVNPIVFETQYMQNPKPLEGLMYDRGFRTYDILPSEQGEKRAYVDTADTGADFLCCIVYYETSTANYILDVLYTQRSMEYTENAVTKILFDNHVNQAIFEGNNGGRGFARTIEKNLRALGDNEIVIKTFTQTQNKKSRIFSASNAVQNLCFFPEGWEARWHNFHVDLSMYMKAGNNAHDDAPDALTGTVENRRKSKRVTFI